mgnify:CR=1 FL=1
MFTVYLCFYGGKTNEQAIDKIYIKGKDWMLNG